MAVHVLVSVVVLENDKLWWEVLHTGTLEQCEAEQRLVQGVAWKGPEKVAEAFTKVMPKAEFEKALKDTADNREKVYSERPDDAPTVMRS